MANENRIIKVEIHMVGEDYVVETTKEFEDQYGGGTQVFRESGGRSLHYALDVARGMVTVSPGSRTDLEQPCRGVGDFEPNPATNRRLA